MKVSLVGRVWESGRQWISSAFGRLVPSTVVDAASSAAYVAGDPIRVVHDLGEKPRAFFSCRKDNGFEVYIEAGDELGWTDDTIIVRCTAASKKFTLLIVGSR
jgi:hypothetical protein